MKSKIIILIIGIFSSSYLFSGDIEDIREQIYDNLKYFNDNNQSPGEYSKHGALEFWSSGGLMQEIRAGEQPSVYESVSLSYKHMEVIVLVPKKAAVVMYYSEGSLKTQNSPTVNHYLTRVTQALVKEDGRWKVRASHWSPVKGGSGTTATTLD
jgi:hypothetical protein